MARLLSVNVGLPRDIEWKGRIVHTGIWKDPVPGRCRVSRLNLEGDGQGDLAGHGGEQRAVLVYQIESYRYWEERLGRRNSSYGQFGENLTIEGLPDDETCIGDRYRIGTALFEVTQPRVTCYRVAIRTNEPQMPALLTSSGRPGFYLRVLEEGELGANDSILLVTRGPEEMTVAEVNALLYSSHHPRARLERALRIPALSPGWRSSFEALARSQDVHPGSSGNAGLVPAAAAQTAKPGFRPLRVSRIDRECADVVSLSFQPTDGRRLTTPLAGQFIVLRLRPERGSPALFRSYSLSGAPTEEQYRISVKIEANSTAGSYLNNNVRIGDIIDVSEPRGAFTLQPGERPVVLVSAGIGATPVLAMLHALASSATPRLVWWLYGARDSKSHPFGMEVRQLLRTLAHGRGWIWYSRPTADDREGREYDSPGHVEVKVLDQIGVPRDGDFYICGPSSFLSELRTGLAAWDVPPERIHSEIFSGGSSLTPGMKAIAVRRPHRPAGDPGTGPLVSFARSGITVRWRLNEQSLLELAEACDVPVRWSCRTGVCHNCESGLISGTVTYQPDPIDPPAEGNILICCAQPRGDVVVDI